MIAGYLGLDKRNDISKEEKIKRMRKWALQPTQVGVFIAWQKHGKKSGFDIDEDKLWDVRIRNHFNDSGHQTSFTLTVRPGLWAQMLLNDKAQKYYSVIHKNILKAIVSLRGKNDGVIRLIMDIQFFSAGKGRRKVLRLLEIAYGKEMLQKAEHDSRYRGKIATKWDNDLRCLKDYGVKITFDEDTYPLAIRPDWTINSKKHAKRPRGYWDFLKKSRIYLVAPGQEKRAALLSKN